MPRYAIYLAPPPEAPLWQTGSALLRYDAASGQAVEHPALPGISRSDWARWSQRPRIYGFHGTLKAPFRLAHGQSLDGLEAALHDFCTARKTFDLPKLELAVLDERDGNGFLALVPDRPSVPLAELEKTVVERFDPFRADLTAEDMAKRNPDALTDRQRDYLQRFGYPYVFDEFRLHFSLTDRIPDAAQVAGALRLYLDETLGPVSMSVDALVLFEQPEPADPFRIRDRFPFLGA